MTAKSDTVTFDVSGTHFRVLRSPTLALHPESVLHQLAEDSEGSTPIFVEANSSIFPYLLDYLRHRKVLIPFTVSKAEIIREAATLGLDITHDKITQESPCLGTCIAMSCDKAGEATKEADEDIAVGKARLLAGLIVKHVIIKMCAGPSATLQVTKSAVEQSVGHSEGDVVISSLLMGMTEQALLKQLQPWALAKGLSLRLVSFTPARGCDRNKVVGRGDFSVELSTVVGGGVKRGREESRS